MKKYVAAMVSSLSDGEVLFGGFEAKLNASLRTNDDGTMFVKNVDVMSQSGRRVYVDSPKFE